jgi:hypothetical protein
MSASEVHAGVKRATEASLMRLEDGWGTPDPEALEELLLHGVKYVFTPVHGGLTRGIPTSYAAPPLNRVLVRPDEPPPVWPDKGEVRGYDFAAVQCVPARSETQSCMSCWRWWTPQDDAVGPRELAVNELRCGSINRQTARCCPSRAR